MIIRQRKRVRLYEYIPEVGAGALPGLPLPSSVRKPLAGFIAARRGRVGTAAFGPETVDAPPKPLAAKGRRRRWFPGMSRRHRRWQ
jgi:hypothetical protein